MGVWRGFCLTHDDNEGKNRRSLGFFLLATTIKVSQTMETDPFDDLLGLEDQFYNEGHQLGVTEGAKAGKIEGRVFGLEKGFEKYMEIGKLHGRSIVWGARLPQKGASGNVQSTSAAAAGVTKGEESSNEEGQAAMKSLPPLLKNTRLEKHIKTLYALAELDTLSTENTEEAVSDFDDRLKRAQGKIKLIEKVIGEESLTDGALGPKGGNSGNIEDVDILKARH